MVGRPTIDDFLVRARRMVDDRVRFVHGGRSVHGVDCAGLIVKPLLDLGVPVQDVVGYDRVGVGGRLLEAVAGQTDPVAWPDREPGDILVMWWSRRTREPQHLGIFDRMSDGEDGLIHSFVDAGRVTRCHLGNWSRRVVYVGRFPDRLLSR
jgi:hypothetical protein